MRFQGVAPLCPQPMSQARAGSGSAGPTHMEAPPLSRPPPERATAWQRASTRTRPRRRRPQNWRRCTCDLQGLGPVLGGPFSRSRAVAAKQHVRVGCGPQPEAGATQPHLNSLWCRGQWATGPRQRSVGARCRAGATPRLGQLAVATATRSRLLAAAKRPST